MEKTKILKKRQLKVPHTFVILFFLVLFASILTWIVPPGQFSYPRFLRIYRSLSGQANRNYRFCQFFSSGMYCGGRNRYADFSSKRSLFPGD